MYLIYYFERVPQSTLARRHAMNEAVYDARPADGPTRGEHAPHAPRRAVCVSRLV